MNPFLSPMFETEGLQLLVLAVCFFFYLGMYHSVRQDRLDKNNKNDER